MTQILITGGTGFIGQRLCTLARQRGMRVAVYSRQPAAKVRQLCGDTVQPIASLAELGSLKSIDHVINLAGEPILSGRWTRHRKQVLRDSRIELTRQLVDALSRLPTKPATFISGSAIGYYGDTGETVCHETQPAGTDFAATLCRDWERAAQPVGALGSRLCMLRTGVVLDGNGGPLQKMLTPFKLGLGGRIGSGQQWFSWISLEDICELIFFLIDNTDCRGAFNATAPEAVRNEVFTRTLAEHLHRPAKLPMPAAVLKAALGEASILLLGSQKVYPQAALQAGFQFQHPTLGQALEHMLPA